MVNEWNDRLLKTQVDGICMWNRIKDFAKETGRKVREGVKDFFTDEEGDTNIIAIVLILVVVIALAAVFRDNIMNIANGIWKAVFSGLGGGKQEQMKKPNFIGE